MALITKIMFFIVAMLTKFAPHRFNKRPLRFVQAICDSLCSVGWNSAADYVGNAKTGKLDSVRDLPIVVGDTHILRGCGRIGTMVAMYTGNGIDQRKNETDKAFAERKAFYKSVIEQLFAGKYMVDDGNGGKKASPKPDFIRLAENTPDVVLMDIVSDDDTLKVGWNAAQRYQLWRDRVAMGASKLAASLSVGYGARRQTFEELQDVTDQVRAAWIQTQNNVPNEYGVPIRDGHVSRLAKLRRKANPTGNLKTTEGGAEYDAYLAELQTGNVKRLQFCATTKELVELVAPVRALGDIPVNADDIGDLLQALIGIEPRTENIVGSRGSFLAYFHAWIVGKAKPAPAAALEVSKALPRRKRKAKAVSASAAE